MEEITRLGVFLIPIVAIVVWGAKEIVQTVMKYQERALMIQRGMHPDAYKQVQGARYEEPKPPSLPR